MSEAADADDSVPWFVKVVMAIAVLVVLFVVVVDLAAFANAL